jgi:hypothetical protein
MGHIDVAMAVFPQGTYGTIILSTCCAKHREGDVCLIYTKCGEESSVFDFDDFDDARHFVKAGILTEGF